MGTDALGAWIARFSVPGTVWFVKRLAAADTSALQAHQRGPSIPRNLIVEIFAPLVRPGGKTSVELSVSIASHDVVQSASANWYDLKTFGGLRRESRLVGWREKSVVTNPAAAGGLAALVFRTGEPSLDMWLCRNRAEERTLSHVVGPVESGCSIVWRPPDDPLLVFTEERASDASGLDDAALENPDAAQLLGAADRRCVGTADERLMQARDRVLRLLASARIRASGPALSRRRVELSMEAFRLQLEKQIGVKFHLDSDGPVARAVGIPGPVTKLVATPAFRGASWVELVGDFSPGTGLLSLQEGLDQSACDAIGDAGVTLVAPEARVPSYPVAARKNIVTVSGLLRALGTGRA